MNAQMIISRFQKRLLNSRKIGDCVFFFIIPIIPIIFAFIIDIWEPTKGESSSTGYGNAWNQMSLGLMLPLSLYLLRMMADYFFGVNLDINSQNKVPLLTFFENNYIRNKIHRKLKKIALNYRITCLVILLDLVFHCFDLREIAPQYFLAFIRPEIPYETLLDNYHNAYWANLFLVRPDIGIRINFSFTFLVYFSQFIIFFIAFIAIILVFLHNIFYLNLIYQRSKVTRDKIPYYIVLNFEDQNSRFGLKKLSSIFNLQVALLFIAGIFALASRVHSIKGINEKMLIYTLNNFEWNNVLSNIKSSKFFDSLFNSLLPTDGQYGILISWLLAFFIILLPSFVKFLPLFSRAVVFYGWSIEDYLREFIPPDDDNKYPMKNRTEVNIIANKFALNSFWSSGDDNARWLFIFVFFVSLIIFYPRKDCIRLIIFFVIAIVLANNFLNCYRWILGYIDQRLVKRTVNITPGDTIMRDQINIDQRRSNFGIGINQGSIESKAKVGGTINEAPKQKLDEATAEIQQLLEQLSQTYPTNTEAEQMMVAEEAIKQIESDPNWKQRVINAAKEGGLASLEKALDNPLGVFIAEAIKGWLEA